MGNLDIYEFASHFTEKMLFPTIRHCHFHRSGFAFSYAPPILVRHSIDFYSVPTAVIASPFYSSTAPRNPTMEEEKQRDLIIEQLKRVRLQIASLAASRVCLFFIIFLRAVKDVCLVAVSKTKPSKDILTAYEAGQRHFGENYVSFKLVSRAV